MNGWRWRLLAVTMAVCVAFAAGPAAAHHSYSIYDRDKPITIEGELTEFAWRNPHVILTVKPEGEDPYRIEWFAIHRVGRSGVQPDSLKPGDHVIVTGSRHPEKKYRILTLIREITRPSDGWSWTRPKYGSGTLHRPGKGG